MNSYLASVPARMAMVEHLNLIIYTSAYMVYTHLGEAQAQMITMQPPQARQALELAVSWWSRWWDCIAGDKSKIGDEWLHNSNPFFLLHICDDDDDWALLAEDFHITCCRDLDSMLAVRNGI